MASLPASDIVATSDAVNRAFDALAVELQPYITSGDCVLLGVLLGGLIPAARLASRLDGDYVMDACQVSRYRGQTSGGRLDWLQPPRRDLAGRTVLVIDDIYDEGVTLEYVVGQCETLGAARVVSAVLVEKRRQRPAERLRPDFVGLEVDDRFIFGCGMDYRHRWRHLPDIRALRDEP